MSVSEVITGFFTDHLHYERRDSVRLDVLEVQNLFAVLLCHCPHLGETGHHFGVQQAGGTEETKQVQSVKGFTLRGLRVTPGISLTVFLAPFSCSRSRFSVPPPSFHEARQSRRVAARLDDLIDQNENKSLLIQSHLSPRTSENTLFVFVWVRVHTVSTV